MERRVFCGAGMITGIFGTKGFGRSATVTGGELTQGGMTFRWDHSKDRLHGMLRAQTKGWIAVGFNERPELAGTRFVIAAPSVTPLVADEHIALVPNHAEISTLGLSRAVSDVWGRYAGGWSELSFSLPHVFADRPALRLNGGEDVHLMLAWSRAPEFDHHSAWRGQFRTRL